jgi:fumarate reductase subunit D
MKAWLSAHMETQLRAKNATGAGDHRASAAATIVRLFTAAFREIAPAVLFFFTAFGFVFVLFKLFVSQYSIEFSAFSRAAIGALILGKVIPLLDWAQSGYNFDSHRRAVVIAGKTFVYGLAVIALGIGDRIFDAYRKAGTLRSGLDLVLANANLDHFLGLVLLISIILAMYLVMQEINRAMGEGALFRLLFKLPAEKHGSVENSS